MFLNQETVIVGDVCLLVPYRRDHVTRYHNWMQDPNLLEATASEPLTLKEEYEMQQSWQCDPNKLTFIVLSKREAVVACGGEGCVDLSFIVGPNEGDSLPPDFIAKTLPAMVGDVNLFLSDEDDGQEDGQQAIDETNDTSAISNASSSVQTATAVNQYRQAEIDIMIAEARARRQGIAREACAMIMMYATTSFNIRRFDCKIHESNHSSQSLFANKLLFHRYAYTECFQQVEMELKRNSKQDIHKTLSKILGQQVLKMWYTAPLSSIQATKLFEKEGH